MLFEDPSWLSVPWALDPLAKTQQNHLLDILVPVPAMLQDLDHVKRLGGGDDPSAGALRHRSLLARVERQLEMLYRWRWRWAGTYGHTVTTTHEHSHTDCPSTPRPAQLPRLSFSRHGSAADISLYNAIQMYLLGIVWDLAPTSGPSIIQACAALARNSVGEGARRAANFEPLRRPGAALSVRDPAVEIARCFEWQSGHHGAGDDPNFLYMFPVGLAMSVLDGERRMRRWLRGLLDGHPVTRGYGSCRLLVEPRRDSLVDALEGTAMERVANFAAYVVKEIDEVGLDGGELSALLPRGQGAMERVENPGLVHLLLLRGRMGEQS